MINDSACLYWLIKQNVRNADHYVLVEFCDIQDFQGIKARWEMLEINLVKEDGIVRGPWTPKLTYIFYPLS